MLALVLKVRVLQLKSHRNVIYRYVILQHFLVRISRFCHQRQGPLSSSEEEVQCNWLKVREITVHVRAYMSWAPFRIKRSRGALIINDRREEGTQVREAG